MLPQDIARFRGKILEEFTAFLLVSLVLLKICLPSFFSTLTLWAEKQLEDSFEKKTELFSPRIVQNPLDKNSSFLWSLFFSFFKGLLQGSVMPCQVWGEAPGSQ